MIFNRLLRNMSAKDQTTKTIQLFRPSTDSKRGKGLFRAIYHTEVTEKIDRS